MIQPDPEKYRAWAAQCLSMAQRAQRDDYKGAWLELAGKWQRLATEAESRLDQALRTNAKKLPTLSACS